MAIQLGNIGIFSLRQFAGAKAQAQQDLGTFTQSVLDAVRRDNSAEADNLERKLADAKQAAAQLGVMSKGMAKSHKADAAEKVKRIKAEIQAMRMAGGDPKMVARRIAQLARELASAAHEYAAAGGGNRTQASAAPGAQPQTAIAEGPAAGAQATAAVAAASAEAAASGGAERDAQHSSTEAHTPDQAKTQFMSDLERRLSEIDETAQEARADQEFIQEVRSVAAQLKALARQQEAKLRQKNEQLDNASDLAQAMARIEKVATQMAGGASLVSPIIDVSV